MTNPPYHIRRNSLGGETLCLPTGSDFQALPMTFLEPFAKILTPHHVSIHRNTREYLTWLARRARINSLRSWLLAMASTAQCELRFHQVSLGPSVQRDVTVRCFCDEGKRFHEFRLSVHQPLFDLPTALQDVYELIDGTIESDCFEAGGLNPFSQLRYADDSYAYDSDAIPAGEDISWFYTANNGDQLFTREAEVYWYYHEDSSVKRVGDLTDVIDSYFTSLLTGSDWQSTLN